MADPIDLSAGLVPKSAPASGGIDLSAGLVPQSSENERNITPPTIQKPTVDMRQVDVLGNPQQSGVSSQGQTAAPEAVVPHGAGVGPAADAARGFVKEAGQTLAPGPKTAAAINQATGLNVPSTQSPELQTKGTAEKVGGGAEGILEFVAGDEALKGLSMAEKLGFAEKLAKLAEAHPAMAKVIQAGLNSARIGSVGAAQGVAKGESLPEAAKTGAVAAGTGAAGEALAGGVKAIAPTVKDIAGVGVPTRAEGKAAGVAEEVARTKPLQELDVNKTQPAAKKAIGQVASEVPTKETSLAAKATTPAKDLGERADQIRAESKPVFKKLDQLTAGQDMQFSDWQKSEKAALRRGDYDAVKKARDAQESIIKQNAGQFDPKDLQNARANWKQASALDKAHDAINSKAVVQPTPVNLRPQGTPDPGYIRGKAFSKQIQALTKDGTLKDAGLTPAHVQSLQDLGTLLEKSGSVQDQGGVLGKAVKAAKIAIGGPVTAGAGYGASAILGKLMSDEGAATKVVKALRSAVGPAAAAGAVRTPAKSDLDDALDKAGVPKNDDPYQRIIAFRNAAKNLPEDTKAATQKAIAAFSNSLVQKTN